MAKVVVPISKIAHWGGLEKHSWNSAKAFADHGHDVTLLTTGPIPNDLRHPNIETVSLGKQSRVSVIHIASFDKWYRRWVKENGADIVFGQDRVTELTHCRPTIGLHGPNLKQRMLYASAIRKMSFSINPLHATILNYERKLFANPKLKCVFPNSGMVGNEVVEQFGFPKERIHVIHNGVDWEQWGKPFSTWRQDRPEILNDLNLDADRFHLLYVGSGFHRKGVAVMLEGLAQVKNSDIHLSIVGRDKHQARYVEQAKRLGLADRVTFFGERKDTERFYQLADACIIPSFYDPFANVTLEALAMGVFVISSKWNGGHEILTEQTGSVINDLLEPSSVADAIESAISRGKTEESAPVIREHVRGFQYSRQLAALVEMTVGDDILSK